LDEATDEMIYDKEPIKRFLDALKLRDKTIALCMLSSSQDSGDVLALNLGYIRRQKDRKRFFFDNNRAKTGVQFRTFFSAEASNYLRRYIELERSDAGDDEPIFVTINSHANRMTTEAIGKNFANAARTAGFEWEDDEVNPFRGKRMRHIFRTACEHAGIGNLWLHIFMGHSLSTNEDYSEIPQAQLEKEYKKVEPYLTIYSSDEATGEIQKQLDLIEKEREEERKAREALRTKNDILEGRLVKMETTISEREKVVEALRENYENLSKQLDESIKELREEILNQRGIEGAKKDLEESKE
jgi:hypothetical protein